MLDDFEANGLAKYVSRATIVSQIGPEQVAYVTGKTQLFEYHALASGSTSCRGACTCALTNASKIIPQPSRHPAHNVAAMNTWGIRSRDLPGHQLPG